MLALVTAGSVALALAAGVILGEYVAQPLKREARRLESRLAGPRLVGPLRERTGRRRGNTHLTRPGRTAQHADPARRHAPAATRASRIASTPRATSAYDVESGESPSRRPPGSR